MLDQIYRDELSFCPALLQMLESGKTLSSDGIALEAHSMSTLNNLLVLKNLYRRQDAKRTLEVGLGYGASCALFAALHQASGRPAEAQHVGIDPLQESLWKNATPALLQRAGLEGFVTLSLRPSAIELPALVSSGQKFDMIYVDGSHLFEDVFVDFYFCRQLLNSNGIIAFDDASLDHVAKVLAFISCNQADAFKEIDLGPLRPDRGHGLKYKIARFLGKTQMRAFQLTGNPERPQGSSLQRF